MNTKCSKQVLRTLGESAELDYVCTEDIKGKTVYVFQDRPDPRKYEFREFNFYEEDLTENNLKLCKKLGVSRTI